MVSEGQRKATLKWRRKYATPDDIDELIQILEVRKEMAKNIKNIDVRTLPLAIQHDIKWLESLDPEDLSYGDVWCELYGSINGSQWGDEIPVEVADYLREKYLGITRED